MMIDNPMDIIVIGGPTASGKTDFALKLAEHYPVEVISADSRQVYRQMDIGTAKVTIEEQQTVCHHLINIIDPDQDMSVADFTRLAHVAIKDVLSRKKIPVVVGGTGLYIRALTEGLLDGPAENCELRARLLAEESQQQGVLHRRLSEVDKALANSLHRRDLTRIIRGLEVFDTTGTPLSTLQHHHRFMEQPYRALKFALSVERPLLYDRIDRRVHAMVASGLIEETQQLLAQGYGAELKSMKTIGYRQMVAHLCEDLPLDEAISWIQRDSRRYAKRQMTWFRKDKAINWVDNNDDFVSILKWIERFLFK